MLCKTREGIIEYIIHKSYYLYVNTYGEYNTTTAYIEYHDDSFFFLYIFCRYAYVRIYKNTYILIGVANSVGS